MTICSRCPSPARWRDPDGRQFCGSHVPANGKPLARLPAPKVDIVERLLGVLTNDDLCREAAAEIRRLRALLEAALDNSKAC
jgi:hypothetical protein